MTATDVTASNGTSVAPTTEKGTSMMDTTLDATTATNGKLMIRRFLTNELK